MPSLPALAPADWQQHRRALSRFVRQRVADPHEAEDIVQDTLLRAHEALHQLHSADRLPAWLARIAAHRIIDLHRARRPADELPDDLAAPEPEHDPVVALAPLLPAMVERLPDTYREAVRLAELQQLPQREVAQRLGLTLSGAKSRVQRGRALLRELVEACCRVVMAGTRIAAFEPRVRPGTRIAAFEPRVRRDTTAARPTACGLHCSQPAA